MFSAVSVRRGSVASTLMISVTDPLLSAGNGICGLIQGQNHHSKEATPSERTMGWRWKGQIRSSASSPAGPSRSQRIGAGVRLPFRWRRCRWPLRLDLPGLLRLVSGSPTDAQRVPGSSFGDLGSRRSRWSTWRWMRRATGKPDRVPPLGRVDLRWRRRRYRRRSFRGWPALPSESEGVKDPRSPCGASSGAVASAPRRAHGRRRGAPSLAFPACRRPCRGTPPSRAFPCRAFRACRHGSSVA